MGVYCERRNDVSCLSCVCFLCVFFMCVSRDVLTVTRQDVGDGWWEGRNTRGESGLFPEGVSGIASSSCQGNLIMIL